jgi:hypothetical protein
MALPIKDTPILKGKNAERIWRKIKENETKTVSVKELAAFRDSNVIFASMLKKSDFR